MSWTQGIQLAEDVPDHIRKLADKIAPEKDLVFEAMVWDTMEPDLLHFDYEKNGIWYTSVTLNIGKLFEKFGDSKNDRNDPEV